MSAAGTAQRDFNKYAGKIINIAEFNRNKNRVFGNVVARVQEVLGYPAALSKALDYMLKKSASDALDAPAFYITREADAALRATGMGRMFDDRRAAPEDAYFEASTLLAKMASYAGEGALSPRFMKSIEQSADHRQKLADGKLANSGYEITIDLLAGTKISAHLFERGITGKTTFSQS